VLPEEIDSAGDSDRPIVDKDAFGRRGGRIDPRFAGCDRDGITMTDDNTLKIMTTLPHAMSVGVVRSKDAENVGRQGLDYFRLKVNKVGWPNLV
jgi:hypothetical protein